MPASSVIISGKNYQFDHHYKDIDSRREQLSALTIPTFGFSFESWYQSGLWSDNCVPCSLFDHELMVSHLTASAMTFALNGKELRALQLGTVMTHPSYRKRGLSRWLIEHTIKEYEGKVDFVFLFANKKVLDFYPKFGFKKAYEHRTVLERPERNSLTVQKLDMSLPEHRNILFKAASQNVPQYRLSALRNQSLIMLYCGPFDLAFLADELYYLPQLDAVAIASFEDETITIHDILSPNKTDIHKIIGALTKPETQKVILGFVPEDTTGFTFQEQNNNLFVKGTDIFDDQLFVPMTART